MLVLVAPPVDVKNSLLLSTLQQPITYLKIVIMSFITLCFPAPQKCSSFTSFSQVTFSRSWITFITLLLANWLLEPWCPESHTVLIPDTGTEVVRTTR